MPPAIEHPPAEPVESEVETDEDEDDLDVSHTSSTKAPATETPATALLTGMIAEKKQSSDQRSPTEATKRSQEVKAMANSRATSPEIEESSSQEDRAEAEVMARTPKTRPAYGVHAQRRRRNQTAEVGSSQPGASSSAKHSPAVAAEAAARSVSKAASTESAPSAQDDTPSSTVVDDEDDGGVVQGSGTRQPKQGKLQSVKPDKKRKLAVSRSPEETYEVAVDDARPSKKARSRDAAKDTQPEKDEANDETPAQTTAKVQTLKTDGSSRKKGRSTKADGIDKPEHSEPPSKNTRLSAAADLEESESDDAPSKSGRLPKVAQDDDSDDEIAVAPASSGNKVSHRSSKRSSAGRSAASKKSSTPSPSVLEGRPPKVLLSGFNDTRDGQLTGWLKKKATVTEEVPGRRAQFICIVRGERLSTTAKVLKTVVANKLVIREKWLVDSKGEGALLDLDDYVHPDLEGKVNVDSRRTLFNGKTLFFTHNAVSSYGQNNWKAIQEVAKDAGAMAIEEGTAVKGDKLTPKSHVIFFGNTQGDKFARSLVKDHGRVVYDKSMFAQTIVRAVLDLDSDEFKL